MTLEQKLKQYRLSRSEYDKITELLGRAPEGLEWALFSALWSEHCSYKSSRIHLKKFFNKNDRVVTSEGENAGVIDLGEGEKLAFKMESHNHPSFIEPYEGAATGVGGILRDIFTMGARPIALANYLCFGEPTAPRITSLIDGVVRGIGGYGNCVGVPTVTGQTEFHHSYNNNILVNAMAVGYFGKDQNPVNSGARGPGNLVVYVGAKTGRDGIHGASMASESFDKDSESKRPTIQKGDPFYEKLLIEACLEVIHQNLVEAIQDMGAAGLTSSSFEMSAKGNLGFDINLDHVPLRDSSLTPEDILLSESQERMLLICKPENLDKIRAIFTRWDLDAVQIGLVTKERIVRLSWKGEVVCQIDPHLLTEKAPLYERPFTKWQSKSKVDKFPTTELSTSDIVNGLKEQLGGILGSSRQWIYEQYDQRVGTKTVRDATHSVAVVKLAESKRLLGIALGCRPFVIRTDAHLGGFDAAVFPALELSAKGFLPLAITDCLNFGNPENRNIMSEFVAALDGLNEACKNLNTPVISGNVSFYNETLGTNITSTPSTGLVGLRESSAILPDDFFVKSGSIVALITLPMVQMDGQWAEIKTGGSKFSGDVDPKVAADFTHMIRQLALSKSVLSTRVVGKFGLPYALARMSKHFAANIENAPRMNFNENLYEIIFEVDQSGLSAFSDLFKLQASESKWTMKCIGTTTESDFNYGGARIKVTDLNQTYTDGWGTKLGLS